MKTKFVQLTWDNLDEITEFLGDQFFDDGGYVANLADGSMRLVWPGERNAKTANEGQWIFKNTKTGQFEARDAP